MLNVQARPRTGKHAVTVWDPFVRLSHWAIVVFFFVGYLETMDPFVHENAGYVLLGLVGLRVAWGFCGPLHARFTSFIRPPSATVGYLAGLLRGRAERYVGHNPAGGWMVVTLLIMLTIVSVSGIAMTTHRFWGDPLVEDIHYVSADLTVGLVALHVCGVIASSLAHRENLVLAMITGKKRREHAAAPPEAEPGPERGTPCRPCAPAAS